MTRAEHIRALLEETGFQVAQCADHLSPTAQGHGTTWLIAARK